MNIVTSSAITMSSQQIADLVNSRHDSVRRTIERLAEKGVIQLPPLVEVKNHLGQTVWLFQVCKRDSFVVVAQLSPEFTAALVDRWQELENGQSVALPKSFADALRLAADQQEQIEQQAQQLAIAAPKVEFVDKYVEATGLKGFRQVAKLLGVKENDFREFLCDNKILYRLGNEWVPYANHIDAGRFEVKTGASDTGHAFNQAKFTPKGVAYVAWLWNKSGGIEMKQLIDILAVNLKTWPDDAVAAVQQCMSDDRIVFLDSLDVEFLMGQWDYKVPCMRIYEQRSSDEFPRASDWKTAVVTRAEWQAAVDALNAPKVVEWPEGATHKFSEPTTSPWRDLSGTTWKWFESGIWRDSGRTSKSLMINQPHRLTKLSIPEKEIPMTDLVVEWDKGSLPPIGSVVEWDGCTFAPEDPQEKDLRVGDQVTIIAHLRDGDFEMAAFTFNPKIHNPARGSIWVNQGAYGCFRPIRTAEQVAAEEREKAIEEMVAVSPLLDKGWSHKVCAALYDNDYRKQVAK